MVLFVMSIDQQLNPSEDTTARSAQFLDEDVEQKPLGRVVTIGLTSLIVIFVGTLIFTSNSYNEHTSRLEEPRRQLAAVAATDVALDIKARAVVVYDVTRDTFLLEKNADVQLPLASLTKVMLALIAIQNLSASTTILITPESLRQEGSTGLRIGERWKLQDLIDATLVPSSNDGAEAIALAIGNGDVLKTVMAMNKRARDIGLNSTYFLNPTGLDESATQAGAYGSSRDVARLFAYITRNYPDFLAGTTQNGVRIISETGIEHTTINTNEALGQIPGLIAGKTGMTNLAGGNLAVVFDLNIGRPIVVVVLGSTSEGRFDDVRTLVRFARSALQQ